MQPARFVNDLYRRFPGRVPIAAAGNHKVGNVYPFVYDTAEAGARALIACFADLEEAGQDFVNVAHLSALAAGVELDAVRRWISDEASQAGVPLRFGRSPVLREGQHWEGDTRPGPRFVHAFRQLQPWRVPLSVGLTVPGGHLFPAVIADDAGRPAGLVGCAWNASADPDLVQVYHVSAFRKRRGTGTMIMHRLCALADAQQVRLFLQAQPQYDDGDEEIPDAKLIAWYRRFGFIGAGMSLTRSPIGERSRAAPDGHQ